MKANIVKTIALIIFNITKAIFKKVVELYKTRADKLNIFLGSRDIVKVFSIYSVNYSGITLTHIPVYGKLSTHLDLLEDEMKELVKSEFPDLNINMSDIKYSSTRSLICTLFKTTILPTT